MSSSYFEQNVGLPCPLCGGHCKGENDTHSLNPFVKERKKISEDPKKVLHSKDGNSLVKLSEGDDGFSN